MTPRLQNNDAPARHKLTQYMYHVAYASLSLDIAYDV